MSKKQKLLTPEIFRQAVLGSFVKLNPRYMMKNPVMFVVEVGFAITLVLSFFPGLFGDAATSNLRAYNIIVSVVLFITVLFANFAESVAEGRGKAQAASLKKTQKDTRARRLQADGTEEDVPSSALKKGDIVLVSAGEIIPGDGEVIEGIASVDESAITGESAPVVRESGGDFCSVTGGTTVVSDWLKIRITSDPGNSFLDRMIALVEGASRKKTPNEIALNTLLVSLIPLGLTWILSRCFLRLTRREWAAYFSTALIMQLLGQWYLFPFISEQPKEYLCYLVLQMLAGFFACAAVYGIAVLVRRSQDKKTPPSASPDEPLGDYLS